MLEVAALRQQFPALQRRVHGRTPLFLDGPGGTQVPERVIEAITHYLTTCNANHGGVFTTSCESDHILHDAHEAVADLLNAPSAEEIVFGQNMTSLTFHLSRSLAKTWKPGDEILVTQLDHDANVSPWTLAARDAGATVKVVNIHPEDCTLDLDDLRHKLSSRTKLLATTCASNAVGTLNDVKRLAQLAHEAGALLFLDAVHYAPHGPIDVQEWDCDFLACSAYKFFGPHVGILWGRRSLLESLSPYKVRPAPRTTPDCWMTGTQNHEGIAGVAAAVEYLASLQPWIAHVNRRFHVHANLIAIRDYETTLTRQLLEGLAARPRFRVWGLTDLHRLHERTPTVSITCRDRTPLQLAQALAEREIYAWNGNFYALNLAERLGLEEHGGLLRLGLVHYNTAEEVERLLQALDEL